MTFEIKLKEKTDENPTIISQGFILDQKTQNLDGKRFEKPRKKYLKA